MDKLEKFIKEIFINLIIAFFTILVGDALINLVYNNYFFEVNKETCLASLFTLVVYKLFQDYNTDYKSIYK